MVLEDTIHCRVEPWVAGLGLCRRGLDDDALSRDGTLGGDLLGGVFGSAGGFVFSVLGFFTAVKVGVCVCGGGGGGLARRFSLQK